MKDPNTAKELIHQLNNTFTQIVSTLDLVLDDLPEKSQLRGDLQIIHQSGLDAVELVNRLQQTLES